MFEPSADLTEMMEAARAAGAGLLGHFRQRGALRVQLKGPADFVSAADLDSERTLQAALLAAHPTYASFSIAPFTTAAKVSALGAQPGGARIASSARDRNSASVAPRASPCSSRTRPR